MLLVNDSGSAGGYVRTDTWLADIAFKAFTGIRFKVPCPPDHLDFGIANYQADVTALVVFSVNVVIPAGTSGPASQAADTHCGRSESDF